MRIIIFTNKIKLGWGLFTFEKAFCEAFGNYHKICYVYNKNEAETDFEINAEIMENKGELFAADLCIYSSFDHGTEPKIKAKKYIQMVHSNVFIHDKKPPENKDLIYISVGEEAQKSLKKKFNIDSLIIPNIMPEILNQRILKLITISRVDTGKGFDRMLILAKELKNKKIPFEWKVYGKITPSFFKCFKYDMDREKVFFNFYDNEPNTAIIYDEISRSDYVVQLSDSEGFCYSIHEGLKIGVPCLVTDWEGVRNTVINGLNGYILDMGMNNIDIYKIYTRIPHDFLYNGGEGYYLWSELLKNEKT